jgi:hypothetical protein
MGKNNKKERRMKNPRNQWENEGGNHGMENSMKKFKKWKNSGKEKEEFLFINISTLFKQGLGLYIIIIYMN